MTKKECKGLFGKMFGHNINSLIKKYTPDPSDKFEGSDIKEVIESRAVKEYKIVCVRCGENYG